MTQSITVTLKCRYQQRYHNNTVCGSYIANTTILQVEMPRSLYVNKNHANKNKLKYCVYIFNFK